MHQIPRTPLNGWKGPTTPVRGLISGSSNHILHCYMGWSSIVSTSSSGVSESTGILWGLRLEGNKLPRPRPLMANFEGIFWGSKHLRMVNLCLFIYIYVFFTMYHHYLGEYLLFFRSILSKSRPKNLKLEVKEIPKNWCTYCWFLIIDVFKMMKSSSPYLTKILCRSLSLWWLVSNIWLSFTTFLMKIPLFDTSFFN